MKTLIFCIFLFALFGFANAQVSVELKKEYEKYIKSNDSFHREIIAHFPMKSSAKHLVEYIILENSSPMETTLSTKYDLSDSLKKSIIKNKDQDYIICKPTFYSDSIFTRVFMINKNLLKGEPGLFCEFFIDMKIEPGIARISKAYFTRRRV